MYTLCFVLEDPYQGLVGSNCVENSAMIYFQDASFLTAYLFIQSPTSEGNSYMLMVNCTNNWFLFQYLDPATSMTTEFTATLGVGGTCSSGVSTALSTSNPTVGIQASSCASANFGLPLFLAFPDAELRPDISSF